MYVTVAGLPDPFRYRPDIDGLRAFAVLSVFIFHLSPSSLPGGFVGVDIFFVISGYVVTGSLLRKPSPNFYTYTADFYARRVKRLWPALIATSVLTCLLLGTTVPPTAKSAGEYFSSTSFGLVGLANVYFASLPRRQVFVVRDPDPRPLPHGKKISGDEGHSSQGGDWQGGGPSTSGGDLEEEVQIPIGGGYFGAADLFAEGPLTSTSTTAAPPSSSSDQASTDLLQEEEEIKKPLGGGYFDDSSSDFDFAKALQDERANKKRRKAKYRIVGHDFHKNPSLHLWSLGVEEQFYFVFPPLLLAACGHRVCATSEPRGKKFTFSIFFGFFTMSLLLSGYWSVYFPDQAFYQMPSRFWQLLTGAIVFDQQLEEEKASFGTGTSDYRPAERIGKSTPGGAVSSITTSVLVTPPADASSPAGEEASAGGVTSVHVSLRRSEEDKMAADSSQDDPNLSLRDGGTGATTSALHNNNDKTATSASSRSFLLLLLADVASLVCLSLSVLTTTAYPFPVPNALLAVFGTATFLYAGSAAPFAQKNVRLAFPLCNNFLSRDILVHIGKLSYPLYLAHWPLIVFFRSVPALGPFKEFLAKVLVVSLAWNLASGIYMILETPIRRWRHRSNFVVFGPAILAAAAVQVFCYQIRSTHEVWYFWGKKIFGVVAGSTSAIGGAPLAENVGDSLAGGMSISIAHNPRNVCNIDPPLPPNAERTSKKHLATFAGQHIVMMGDSTMRYQYVNLVYRVTHGAPPPFEFWELTFSNTTDRILPGRLTPPDSKTLDAYGQRYDNWYKGTTHFFTHTQSSNWTAEFEVAAPVERGIQGNWSSPRIHVSHACDCGRPKEDPNRFFENRFHVVKNVGDESASVHLSYVQWIFYVLRINILGIFGYAPLHGHWHPEVQGYPIRLNCSVGNCTTSEDVVFNHIKDYTRMLEDYVMKLRPTPTYLVLNTAIWRLLDERHFKLLIKQGIDLWRRYGTKFVWKTGGAVGIPEVDHAGNPIRYKSPAKVLEMKQWVEAENERIGGHAVEEMRWLEDVMREEDAKTVVAVSAEGAVEGETLGAGKTPGETGAARTSGGATPGAGGATLPAGTAARQAWMIFDANRFTARFQSEFWWDFRHQREKLVSFLNQAMCAEMGLVLPERDAQGAVDYGRA